MPNVYDEVGMHISSASKFQNPYLFGNIPLHYVFSSPFISFMCLFHDSLQLKKIMLADNKVSIRY